MKVECPHCGLVVRREKNYYLGFATIDGRCSQRCNRCMRPYLVNVWEGTTCVSPEHDGISSGLRSSAQGATTGSSAPRHGSDDGDENS